MRIFARMSYQIGNAINSLAVDESLNEIVYFVICLFIFYSSFYRKKYDDTII